MSSRRDDASRDPFAGATTDSTEAGAASRWSRRRFLQGTGAAAGLVVAPAFLKTARGDSLHLGSELFSLGVASGDPGARSVVLWTRLAPDPLAGGGMRRPTRVLWEVAADYGMTHVLRRGVTVALPRHGHAVRVVVRGLPSNRWLHYRFKALGEYSRVGRTRTFPGYRDHAERMRCAVVSCQNYTQGFYPAYRDMLEQDLDFVVHTGDYIYEGGGSALPGLGPERDHDGGETFSLADYRNRYALYRLDRDLQNAHAELPFVVTWDDHEVDNNYAGDVAEESAPFQGQQFLERRQNAYRVYSESMPLRPWNRQYGSAPMRLFRKLRFGQLANLYQLDTRQFRSDQPASDNFGSTDPDSQAIQPLVQSLVGDELFDADGILDPAATMLGDRQERWLEWSLRYSRATWNVLAQQVMMMPWNLVETTRQFVLAQTPPEQQSFISGLFDEVDNVFNVDAWDGYPAARERLFDLLRRSGASNPIVLTGDIHSAWGAELLEDFGQPETSDLLAVEFVCTSIASTFLEPDPRPADAVVRAGLGDNPHIKYFNGLFRGYALCDVDHERWQTTYRAAGALDSLVDPDPLALVPRTDSPVATDAVVEIESGFNVPGSGKRLTAKFARFPL